MNFKNEKKYAQKSENIPHVKLNLGCGQQIIDNWVNVDYFIGARLAKFKIFNFFFNISWDKRIFIHDLTKKFPWKDNSVDVIYTSHTLEHFDREEGLFVLNESKRVLKKGGIIRILVPDLKEIVASYINKEYPADRFLEGLLVLNKKTNSKFKNFLNYFFQFPHKCMYDNETLLSILKNLGFNAQIKKMHESEIDGIEKFEIEGRAYKAVIVEGIKL